MPAAIWTGAGPHSSWPDGRIRGCRARLRAAVGRGAQGRWALCLGRRAERRLGAGASAPAALASRGLCHSPRQRPEQLRISVLVSLGVSIRVSPHCEVPVLTSRLPALRPAPPPQDRIPCRPAAGFAPRESCSWTRPRRPGSPRPTPAARFTGWRGCRPGQNRSEGAGGGPSAVPTGQNVPAGDQGGRSSARRTPPSFLAGPDRRPMPPSVSAGARAGAATRRSRFDTLSRSLPGRARARRPGSSQDRRERPGRRHTYCVTAARTICL